MGEPTFQQSAREPEVNPGLRVDPPASSRARGALNSPNAPFSGTVTFPLLQQTLYEPRRKDVPLPVPSLHPAAGRRAQHARDLRPVPRVSRGL